MYKYIYCICRGEREKNQHKQQKSNRRKKALPKYNRQLNIIHFGVVCVCVSQTCYTAYLLYIIQIEIWLIVDNVVCLDCFFEASFFSCSFLFLLCCLYFLFFRMFLCALCAATRHIHVSFLSWKLGCGKTMPLTLSSNMRFFSFTWYAYWDYIAKLCTNHSSVWRFSSIFLPPSHRFYNVFPRFNRNEQTGRESKKTIIVIILVFLHIFFILFRLSTFNINPRSSVFMMIIIAFRTTYVII